MAEVLAAWEASIIASTLNAMPVVPIDGAPGSKRFSATRRKATAISLLPAGRYVAAGELPIWRAPQARSAMTPLRTRKQP